MAITPKIALQRLIDHTDFTHEEMLEIMQQIMNSRRSRLPAFCLPCASRVKP